MKNKAVDVTRFFLKNNESIHEGEGELCYKALPCELKLEEAEDGRMAIKGWASTKDQDLADDVILPKAFKSSLQKFLGKGTMLFMHDWWALPVGKWDTATIKSNGLWTEGRIAETTTGVDLKELINLGVLNALSVGFRIVKSETDEDSGVRTIKDLELFEVSIVNAGMNPAALFSQAKSLNINIPNPNESPKHDDRGSRQKEPIMADIDKSTLDMVKKVEALVGEHESALEKASSELSTLSTSVKEQAGMLSAIHTKHEDMEKGIIPKAEFDAFAKKLGEDILDIQGQVAKAKALQKVQDTQIPMSDWRMLQTKDGLPIIAPLDDSGRPLSAIEQKAWQLFEQPVKLDGERGVALKALRELYDNCVILRAYYTGHGRFNPQNLKTFQLLHEYLQVYDGGKYSDLAKAMYSTGTNLGDEWVPTYMSSQLYDLYRLTPSLESYIPSFEMPTNPYEWPIKTSGVTLYRAAEAAVNNPDQLTKSNIGTDKITFTAETFAGACAVSPQMIEDALIPIVPEINAELAFGCRDGYEGMLVNGDDTSTHRDTAAAYITEAYPEMYEDGFRMLAVDASQTYSCRSTTAGASGTSFVAGDIRYARKMMGKMGVNPRDLLYVMNTDVWFHCLNMDQFAKPGDYGAGATWQTGSLQMIDGSEVILTDKMANDLAANGLDTSASGTNSAMLCLNKTAFKIGNKRGITVESDKNIGTQQFTFVASMRKSFKKMSASTLYPVAMGVAIHT